MGPDQLMCICWDNCNLDIPSVDHGLYLLLKKPLKCITNNKHEPRSTDVYLFG